MRNNIGKTLTTLMVLLMATVNVFGVTKEQADESYKKGNYQQAIAEYTELLRHGVSASLYYNLGNAYYRSDNLPHAILNYERALRLSPGDKDIRFNLQFASSKTIDKITPVDDNVFEALYKSVVSFTSVDNWARTGIVSVILALVLMLAFLFAGSVTVRKVGFFGSVAFLVVFAFSTLFAWQQKSDLEHSSAAIVMMPSASVRQSPVNNAAESFVIHEGTRVDITDSGIKGWSGIRLGDGREGWIKTSALEMI